MVALIVLFEAAAQDAHPLFHLGDCPMLSSAIGRLLFIHLRCCPDLSGDPNPQYRRVSNAALANAALVPSSKNWQKYLGGQKSCRTKVPRIFRFFVPNFAPNFALNFPRIFRGVFVLRFVGDGDQKKLTKNPCHFSMQNSQANTKEKFTKPFWGAGKVKNIRDGGVR